MTIKIAMVPREEIGTVWPIVGPMLDPAVMRTKGRFHIADVLETLMQGLSSVWIAYDTEANNEIIGCVHFTIAVYPTGQTAGRLDYLGGRERDTWFDPMWYTLARYAKENNCAKLEMSARPGLVPYVVERYGGKKLSTNLEVDLSEKRYG